MRRSFVIIVCSVNCAEKRRTFNGPAFAMFELFKYQKLHRQMIGATHTIMYPAIGNLRHKAFLNEEIIDPHGTNALAVCECTGFLSRMEMSVCINETILQD